MGERRFSKKNRFVSFLLAIAMVLTLLPIGAVQAKAEGSRQIIMHFENSTNWEAVYTQIAEGDNSWKDIFFAENSLKAAVSASASRPLKKTR